MELTPIDMILTFLILAGGLWGLMAGATRAVGSFALIIALVTFTHAYPDLSTRFGSAPAVRFLLFLFLAFIGLVTYGFVANIIRGAVRSAGAIPFDRLLGLGLGLVAGAILAGALVWGLEMYGGVRGRLLLRGSTLAPALSEFIRQLVVFSRRLFPRSGAEKGP